jgi:aldose 1-epimerase
MNGSNALAIEKKYWGDQGGKEVYLFCLKNAAGSALYVSNYGAVAQAFLVKDKNGNPIDVLLGYDSLEEYVKDEFYIGAIVGRYSNRIAGGEVLIDGKKYSLATRDGGYHLHGGKEGFNKKVFDYKILQSDTPSIKFFYTSPHLEEGFPGTINFAVTYTLDDADNWIIDYECETDKTTIINFTQHAYFNLNGHNSGDITEQVLQIFSSNYLPVNKMQVPSGKPASVTGTNFDFHKGLPIGKNINQADEQLILSNGYDHTWTLKDQASSTLLRAATVKSNDNGLQLEVYTSEPSVHFYAGNYLENISGKNNNIYQRQQGFCLETQHYPDTPNHPDFPSTILRPGQKFTSKTIYALSIIKE